MATERGAFLPRAMANRSPWSKRFRPCVHQTIVLACNPWVREQNPGKPGNFSACQERAVWSCGSGSPRPGGLRESNSDGTEFLVVLWHFKVREWVQVPRCSDSVVKIAPEIGSHDQIFISPHFRTNAQSHQPRQIYGRLNSPKPLPALSYRSMHEEPAVIVHLDYWPLKNRYTTLN